MGIPVVEVSAIPMAKALPNVLNLPLISGFVKSSIAAAANEYVAPKSMTLNLGQMLAGDGIKKDTDALGVICVTIHHAEGLSAQDRSGSSDPYIVVAFAKFGKPLYSTRIIFQDLNPVFEETCFLLVSQDEVNSDEDLSLQLWDSDKRTADDLIGRINVPLKEVMGVKNEMKTRKDPLKGFQDADDMSGHLTWSVGYFEKAKLNRKLTKDEGQNASLPKEAKESAAPPPQGTQVDSNEEKLALSTPPDPRYHSGILSIIVEHINNLEFQNLKGASGSDRGEGAAGQDTDDPSEQGKNLPSAYAEIVINDDLVYKTRTKQYTSMPLFNAGCERFIRDWQNTIVRIVVRSARLREHDPIMGVIKDLLKDSSQVSRLFSLQEGIGFGRAKISVLFKAVEAELPAPLRGWETGTVEILSDVKLEVQNKEHADTLAGKKLTIRTNATSTKLPPASASVNERGEVIFDVSNMIRLPVYERFSTPLLFEFGSGSSLPGMKSGPYAVAALWLQDVEDDREMDIRVPILLGKNTQQLRQNYNNEFLAKSHEHEVIGHLVCKFQLDSGLDPAHEQYIDSQTARHEYEAFDRIEGQARIAEMNSHAADDGVIDKKEQKEIDKANKHALQSRQRGTYQYAPVRTSVWAKDGVKSRLRKLTGKSSRAQTVETEA